MTAIVTTINLTYRGAFSEKMLMSTVNACATRARLGVSLRQWGKNPAGMKNPAPPPVLEATTGWTYEEHPMADAPLPAYSCSMKHNKQFQDYYQLPDDDDEESDHIQARFQRLARKVRDKSDSARAKFALLAGRQEEPAFAQAEQELLPAMSVPN